MNPRHPIVLTQATCFGAIRSLQLERLCQRHLKRSALFAHLRVHLNEGLVVRALHPKSQLMGYTATSAGLLRALGVERDLENSVREIDQPHTVVVT